MVFSEPGHPHAEEGHDPNLDPLDILDCVLRHTYECFKVGTDLFHRNARWFMSTEMDWRFEHGTWVVRFADEAEATVARLMSAMGLP